MNYDALIDNLTCTFEKVPHLLVNPMYLPCCRRTVCNRCIIKSCGELGNKIFKCPLCKETSRIRIVKDECEDLEPNTQVQADLERYTIDINHHLLRRLESTVNNVQERFDSNEEYLVKRKEFIEEEIRVQVAGLKAQLDDYEKNMKQKLADSCRNSSENLRAFCQNHQANIDQIKESTNDLKLKAFSYANGRKTDFEKADLGHTKEEVYLNTLPQQNSINRIFQHISDLSRLNGSVSSYIDEIKFYPNIEPFTETVVGTLKTVKHIEQEEQFRNVKMQKELSSVRMMPDSKKRMPMSPQYLTILDEFNILFTDSYTRRLTQIKLETGDYVQSTSLNGLLKNPSGLCVNQKEGLIYLVDLDQPSVFKLDRNFNVLKQFGSRDLRLPRGIFYDENSQNGNCLYVCDQLNERVAIFNDKEQLRGEIVLTAAHKLIPSYNTVKKGKYDSVEIEEEFKFSPANVTVTSTHIYVCDEWIASNCIRVFDKLTKDLVRNIGDLQAWNPLATFIDTNDNVCTIARLYYETGVPYMFVFSKSGQLLYKTNLNISDSDLIRDFKVDRWTDVTNYGLVVCGDSRLHFIRFE